jgi:hypothetical protein
MAETRERSPGWVKLVLLAYGLSAALFIATSDAGTWRWQPWALLTAVWAGLRIVQAGGGRGDERARNRNTGRDRTPFTVHVISAIILLVAAWYVLWGSRVHPLPGMLHAPLLHV